MTEDDLTALKEKIRAAFAARPYPGDDQLVVDLNDWEGTEIADAFRGLHWSEVAPDVIEYNASAMSFFTPTAWQFYAPAFMFAELDDPGGNAGFSFCLALIPPDVRAEQHKKRENLQLPSFEALGFSPEQAALMNNGWEQVKEFIQQQSADGTFEEYERTRFASQMDSLNAEEKSVIREFLEYVQGDEDDRLALERYWRQF